MNILSAFEDLSDELLVDSYLRSIELKLDEDFILLLKDELVGRGIIIIP